MSDYYILKNQNSDIEREYLMNKKEGAG